MMKNMLSKKQDQEPPSEAHLKFENRPPVAIDDEYCLSHACTDCPLFYTCTDQERIYGLFIEQLREELGELDDPVFCPKCLLPMREQWLDLVDETEIPTGDAVLVY